MSACKLIALDLDDLAVVSAHVQEATTCCADIHWRPRDGRVLVALRRAESGQPAVLRFDRVTACQTRDICHDDPQHALELIAVDFVATDAPAGLVTLYFANNATMRLAVECLECALADIG